MDARITKQRLGNLLSYDWLKILGVIVAAVVLLYVLFTMIATRPTVEQVYSVFTYGGLKIGDDSSDFEDDLDGAFSFDILEAEMVNFEAGSLGEQALTARRGVLEGDAVLVADYTEEEGDTPFSLLVTNYGTFHPAEKTYSGFYEIPTLLDDMKAYLSTYFDLPATDADETFTSEAPIEAQIEASFARKNGSDKRFKTDAQKETGLALERARVLQLREDYLFVKAAFERGDVTTVDYVYLVGEEEYRFPFGIDLGKLTGLDDLAFYYSNGQKTTEKLTLTFFYNGARAEDIKFENLTFLRYLLETYAPAHS